MLLWLKQAKYASVLLYSLFKVRDSMTFWRGIVVFGGS